MIGRFFRWLTEPDAKPEDVERFGEAKIERAFGVAILAEPKRRRICTAIREWVEGIWREERVQLIDRLFLRFALMVVDLPASESHHHSVPFGLLDHSLEVAYHVVQALEGPRYRISEDYGTNYHGKPMWHYAALAGGLTHDLGKVLDLEVAMPDGKDRWNPQAEPLALFCRRNGLEKTGPEFWKHRPGRGVRFHAWQGPLLIPLVLPPAAPAYLGPRLALVSNALIAQTLDRAPEPLDPIAAHIAKTIHEADVETSKANREAGKPSAPPALEDSPMPPPPAPVSTPAMPALNLEKAPPRPPVDPATVLRHFTEALRVAIQKGWIPLNEEGGLYIGRKYTYLHYPEGMSKVIGLMKSQGSDLEDRFEDDLDLDPEMSRTDAVPETRVFRALLAHGRLPHSTETYSWVQQAEIHHPGVSEPSFEQVVLMAPMLFEDLPVFKGRMELEAIGDPEQEGDQATTVERPPEQDAPQLPSLQDGYRRRVEAEMEPPRLLRTFTEALQSGVFHRPGSWSPVYIRPDFTWALVPATFRILCQRMGIAFTTEVENGILRSLAGMPDLARRKDGQALYRIRIHPESKDPVWAFAIETRCVLPPDNITRLEVWAHPIRVIDDPIPGEYAA